MGTTNPATRPFLVIVGSGIDVKRGYTNLANVFVKSFYRFFDFLLEKGRIKLNPQQLWIFEKAI